MVKTKLTSLLKSIVLVFFLSGCGVPHNGEKNFYREDGSLEKIQTYKDGVLTNIKFYREDETLEEMQCYSNLSLHKVYVYREDETLKARRNFGLYVHTDPVFQPEKSWKDKWIDWVGKYLERMSKGGREKEEYLKKNFRPMKQPMSHSAYWTYLDENGQLEYIENYKEGIKTEEKD